MKHTGSLHHRPRARSLRATLCAAALCLPMAAATAWAAPVASNGVAAQDGSAATSAEGIRRRLETDFARDPLLAGSHIRVEVTDRAVVLRGTVTGENQRRRARAAALAYRGIGDQHVVDELEISGRA